MEKQSVNDVYQRLVKNKLFQTFLSLGTELPLESRLELTSKDCTQYVSLGNLLQNIFSMYLR